MAMLHVIITRNVTHEPWSEEAKSVVKDHCDGLMGKVGVDNFQLT